VALWPPINYAKRTQFPQRQNQRNPCAPCHSDRRHASSVPKWRNLLQYSRRLPNRLFGPIYQEITPCIMQNKANFLNARTNATFFAAKGYENKPPLGDSKKQTQSNPIPPPRRDEIRDTRYENSPPAIRNTQYAIRNTNPIKPNLPDTEMNVHFCDKRDYENKSAFGVQKNKAKSNPISNAEMPYSACRTRDCHASDNKYGFDFIW